MMQNTVFLNSGIMPPIFHLIKTGSAQVVMEWEIKKCSIPCIGRPDMTPIEIL